MRTSFTTLRFLVPAWIGIAALALGGAEALADSQTNQTNVSINDNSPTVQTINRNEASYIGRHISLNGQIDRVIGPGAYIVSDPGRSDSADHRILVLTSGQAQSAGMTRQNKGSNNQQQAGIAGTTFKEGDKINLNGKVEQLSISNEADTFSPKSEQETVHESAMTMPVVVIQPGSQGARAQR